MGTGGRRSKTAAARASKTPALDTLRVEEQAGVMELLLRSAPRLATDAERIARELLADTSVEAVAEEVEWGLRSRGADELQGRAGRQRYGYVEPTEAAWEILGQALDPHLKDVERLLRLRMRSAAHDTALGIVAGLYRCRDVDDPELLLSWAPDLPADHADGPLRMLREAGIDVPEGELQEMAPEWAG